MLQNILNLRGIEILSKHKQKVITGGRDSFQCSCGGESSHFHLKASSIENALGKAGRRCNGQGATCQGIISLAPAG